jgi:predicted dienelactone hydrolase
MKASHLISTITIASLSTFLASIPLLAQETPRPAVGGIKQLDRNRTAGMEGDGAGPMTSQVKPVEIPEAASPIQTLDAKAGVKVEYREYPGYGHGFYFGGGDDRWGKGADEAVVEAVVRDARAFLGVSMHGASNKAYDPLALPAEKPAAPLDLTVTDATRQRELPIRVYLPGGKTAAPVVLFSHGLGGNREGSAYLGNHWAARGYVAVFLQHPGSDDGVWKKQPILGRERSMRDAASGANFLLRVKDVPAVLDQLARWQEAKDHPLAGRLDLKRVGMSGHSFGAVTTQAVSGQTAPGGGQWFTDPRIKAAIAFSPSEPAKGTPAQAFGKVAMPWLLMTGTKDVARLGGGTIGAATVEKRLSVYPALPAGSKYELVLEGAEHSAFTDRALPGESGTRNPNHHRAILALSTAFWDAYLKGDAAARAWLDGSGPRSVLETKDRWQTK